VPSRTWSARGGTAEARFKGLHNHGGARRDREKAADLAGHFCGSAEDVNAYL